jgi:Domain of unknown function (DUF4349)
MEPFRDDNDLIAELTALRPTPRPAFAAELDERAAAGFPRRSPLGRLVARLQAIQPRRVLIPAGATALAAIAVATVVVAVNEPKTDPASLAQISPSDPPASEPKASGGEDSSGVQYEAIVPTAGAPERGMSSSGAAGTAGAGTASSDTGPFASEASHRDVERSAEMVLGADPTEVGGAAAKVFDAVHASDGIVLRSSVSGGPAGEAGATFDLLIPSPKLSDALAAFSGIAEVRSRHEATTDITAPTVRTGELLRDSRARIEGLLTQLAQADTDAERTAAETELRAERRHNSYLRSQLSTLERRATFSRVSLRIESGTPTSPEDASGWGIGDALDDAGHILAIAAGIAIVGLAVVAPIALIALLAWLANRVRIRRGRERALE